MPVCLQPYMYARMLTYVRSNLQHPPTIAAISEQRLPRLIKSSSVIWWFLLAAVCFVWPLHLTNLHLSCYIASTIYPKEGVSAAE